MPTRKRAGQPVTVEDEQETQRLADADTQVIAEAETQRLNEVGDAGEIIEIKEEADSDIEYIDEDVGYSNLTVQHNLGPKSHQEAQSAHFPFQCDLCHSAFSDQFGFFEHLKSHYDTLSRIPGSAPAAKVKNGSSGRKAGRKPKAKLVLPPSPPLVPEVTSKETLTRSKTKILSTIVEEGTRSSRRECTNPIPSERFTCLKCQRHFKVAARLQAHMESFHGDPIERKSLEEPKPNSRISTRSKRVKKSAVKLEADHTSVNEPVSENGPESLEPVDESPESVDEFPDPELIDESSEPEDEPFDSDWEAGDGYEEVKGEEITAEFACTSCDDLRFPTQNELNLHSWREHTDADVNKNMCKTCGEVLRTDRKLSYHMKKHQAVSEGQLLSVSTGRLKGRFPCADCDRVFNHKNSLSYHRKSHSGIRNHVCGTCGKAFFATSALKVHLRLHSGEKPYACKECGRMFRQWGDLTYHMISLHSNLRAYKCDFCGKDFARKYSLTVHRRIHTGERTYQCEFCEKNFRASSYLQNHRRIHTGEKPHECDICGKPFRVRSDMSRHRTSHTRQPPATNVGENATGAPGRKAAVTKANKPAKNVKGSESEPTRNLVAVDESGQIIPLEPQIAQQLRAGQVIQVPVVAAAQSQKRLAVKSEGSLVTTRDIINIDFQSPNIEGDTVTEDSAIVYEVQESGNPNSAQGSMYVWPVFMS